MARGGARPNSGPKPRPKLPPVGDKDFAARVLERIGKPGWRITNFEAVKSADDFAVYYLSKGDATAYSLFDRLREKRDGTAVRNLNHMHDKPIDLNVTVSMAEIVRQVRLRKQEYERNRQ